MNCTIRTAEPEDAAALAAVESTCFPEAEAASAKSIIERIQVFPESFYLAEADGAIIGFINGSVTDSRVISDNFFEDASLHNPHGAYQCIFGLDVTPAYRRQGIAAALMNRLIEAARNQGRRGLILTCKDHLIRYYEKFGYRNLGVSASTHGGAVWYDMMLEFE